MSMTLTFEIRVHLIRMKCMKLLQPKGRKSQYRDKIEVLRSAQNKYLRMLPKFELETHGVPMLTMPE
jgi:hypothetical protein